jgi:hypothetical protein
MNRHPAHPHEHPRAHRLAGWQRVALYVTGATLLLTGGVWLAVHYSVGAGAGELPHPYEVWCLRLHGLAAFAGAFVLGILAAAHVPQGWRLGRRRRWAGQRTSGAVLCTTGAALVLSGYLLFYFAPESLRPALGWAHAAIGVAMGLLLAAHRRGAQGRGSVD